LPIVARGGVTIGWPAIVPSCTGNWYVTGRSSSGTKAIAGCADSAARTSRAPNATIVDDSASAIAIM
jgi:hypothetical protein